MSTINSRKITKTNRFYNSSKRKTKQSGGQSISELIKYISYYFTELKKFDDFIIRFNKAKESVKQEYESFKADKDFYKMALDEKMDNINSWVLATKNKVVFSKYLEEEEMNNNNSKSIKLRSLENRIKLADAQINIAEKNLKQLHKEQNENKSEFNRMHNKFKKNIDKFEEVLKDYTNIAEFKLKVKTLNNKYLKLVKMKKDGLSKKHLQLIDAYDKKKGEYKRVLSFNDTKMEKLTKFISDYTEFRKLVEQYNNEFIEKDVNDIQQELENWSSEINKLYDTLQEILELNKQNKSTIEQLTKKLQELNNVIKISEDSKQREVMSNIMREYEKILQYDKTNMDNIEDIKYKYSNNIGYSNHKMNELKNKTEEIYIISNIIDRSLKGIRKFL